MSRILLICVSFASWVAVPSVAYGQDLTRLTHDAVELECRIVDKGLRVGDLALRIEGGRAFLLDVEEQGSRNIPRLTPQELKVVNDELDVLDGSVVTTASFRNTSGHASLLLAEGGRLSVSLTPMPLADGESADLHLNVDLQGADGLEPHAAGICSQKRIAQSPLSEQEIARLIDNAENGVNDVLRASQPAIPPPAVRADPSSNTQRETRGEETAESVTLPLQIARCAYVANDARDGVLSFTLEGGRGYERASRFGSGTEVEKTRRVMRIDNDPSGVFADLAPAGQLGNRPGPHSEFIDMEGATWRLIFSDSVFLRRLTRQNIASLDTVRLVLSPLHRGGAQEGGAKATFVALCELVSSPQTPLTKSEVRDYLWQ